MRLPTALSTPLAPAVPVAVAVLVALVALVPGTPATAVAPAPICGNSASGDFPIDTRLRGGPDRYSPGGDWRAWRLELRNTTRRACRAIHPVAVFADRDHELRPPHIGLEFYDSAGKTWRPVSFATTDEDENVGVFDGFEGFTVGARRSAEVRLRTRFTADAPHGPVTVNVTAMQRRDNDGEWVGQSGDYDFGIETRPGGVGGETREEPGAGRRGGDGPGTVERPPQLAATGNRRGAVLLGLGLTSGALMAIGSALVVRASRRSGR